MSPVLLNPSRFGASVGAGYSAAVLTDSPTIWARLDAVTAVTVSAATSSSNFPGDTPANAFDGDPSTVFTTNGTSTGWLRAQLSGAATLTAYYITSRPAFQTRAPNAWTFEGSNDGSSWTTLDTRTGVTWSSTGETKGYSFSNTTAYLYYRLNVSANNGDTYMGLNELSFPYAADSSGNSRHILQPAGVVPTIAADGQVLTSSLEWGASAGFLRSAFEQAQPSIGTFEFWIKIAANPAANLTLLSWSPNNGGSGSNLYAQLLTTGKIRLALFNGSTINADSASALTTGVWHHAIASVGAAGMKVRVDKTNTGSNSPTGATVPSGTTSFRVHGRYNGAGNVEQTGAVKLSEVAYYPTQLSDARTDAHFDAA